MKKLSYFLAGVGCTLLCATVVVPVLAAQFEATFNSINIQSDGHPIANVGESFPLADGSKVPYSILYNGTTYLPMRKVAEIVNKDVVYDNNSRTANLVKKGETMDNNSSALDNFKKYTIGDRECVRFDDITPKSIGPLLSGFILESDDNGATYHAKLGISKYFATDKKSRSAICESIPLLFKDGDSHVSANIAEVHSLAYLDVSVATNIVLFYKANELLSYNTNDSHVILNAGGEPVYRITYDEFVASLQK